MFLYLLVLALLSNWPYKLDIPEKQEREAEYSWENQHRNPHVQYLWTWPYWFG